jgi:hypothetical protein
MTRITTNELNICGQLPRKVVIARSVATKQSHEIASLRPLAYEFRGFARNDNIREICYHPCNS